MAYPRFRRARAHKFAVRTAGNLALASTTIVAVDTALDLTVEAQAGDTLLVSLNAKVQNQANGIYFNAATMNGSTVINGVHGGALTNYTQVPSWYVSASVFGSVGQPWHYTVTAADVINGHVTVRLYYTTDNTTARTVEAIAAVPLQFAVRNLGPADPN